MNNRSNAVFDQINPLQWRHNEHNGALNHRHLHYLLILLLRCRSKITSKLHVTGLCQGNPPVNGFPSQSASNAKNVTIWWRYYVFVIFQWNVDYHTFALCDTDLHFLSSRIQSNLCKMQLISSTKIYFGYPFMGTQMVTEIWRLTS